MKLSFCCVIILSSFTISAFAQQQDSVTLPRDWFLEDPVMDHLMGISAEKAYGTLLAGRPSKTVIVAVIDSGVDPEHEDLKSIMWTNEREIAGNGIDDDHNGYIDDVHGWNFLGSSAGNVAYDTYELTREVIRYRKKYEGITEKTVTKKDKADYEQFQKLQTKFEKLKTKNTEEYDLYSKLYSSLTFCVDTLKTILKTDSISPGMLEAYQPTEPVMTSVKEFIQNIFRKTNNDVPLNEFLRQIREGYEYYGVIVNYGYNENYDSRKIVGDNYSNLNERIYGNNDVKGPDALHGTHVAGIIAADRKNNIGINGIADNVRIMSVRAVPNGDERDKDVANAIRYAVDNGAQIINMSFGKGFSPEKEAVDKAVKYAEDKGVLLVHAAGNDGDDNDSEPNFPTRTYANGKLAKNWIEVGASSAGQDSKLVAPFSNYGKKSVDVFAPGVRIYSTTPDNQYLNEDGTSMASPVTAGVAALLLSYFPDLSTQQVRDILIKSTRRFDMRVEQPGKKKMVPFSELSVSGGIVNVYDAVALALKTSKPLKR